MSQQAKQIVRRIIAQDLSPHPLYDRGPGRRRGQSGKPLDGTHATRSWIGREGRPDDGDLDLPDCKWL